MARIIKKYPDKTLEEYTSFRNTVLEGIEITHNGAPLLDEPKIKRELEKQIEKALPLFERRNPYMGEIDGHVQSRYNKNNKKSKNLTHRTSAIAAEVLLRRIVNRFIANLMEEHPERDFEEYNIFSIKMKHFILLSIASEENLSLSLIEKDTMQFFEAELSLFEKQIPYTGIDEGQDGLEEGLRYE